MKEQRQNKKNCYIGLKNLIFLLLIGLLCVGCGPRKVALDEQNYHTTQELNQRVAELEGRLLALGLQVQTNQERVYEVRNRSGKKTGMLAYPSVATAGVQAPAAVVVPSRSTRTTRPAAPKKNTTHVPVPQPVATQGKQPATAPLGQQPVMPAPSAAPAGPGYSLPPETAMYLPGDSNAPSVSGGVGVPQMPPVGAPSLPPANMPVTPGSSLSPVLPPANTPGVSSASSGVLIAQALPPKAQPYGAPVASPALATKSTPGEQAEYKQALDLVMRGQSQAGREGLQTFLQSHPQSKLAPNAYYWVGESYYSQGNYNDALLAFRQVTTNYPKHHKTSDALLKAGMTYQRMGDVENAKVHYQTLITNFPRSNAAKIAKSKRL